MSSTAALRSLDVVGAERAQRRDEFVDQSGRRGRPGGHPDGAGPGQPAQVDVADAVDQVGRAPARCATSTRRTELEELAEPTTRTTSLRRRPSARPAAGWWWRSRCRPRRARPAPGSAAAAPARSRRPRPPRAWSAPGTTPAPGRRPGPGRPRRCRSPAGSPGASPSVPSTSSCPSCPISSTVSPRPAKRRASACTLVTSGQVASMTGSPRSAAARRTAGETPCAEKTVSAPSGTSSSSSTKTAPRRSQIGDDVGVVHDLLADVDRRAVPFQGLLHHRDRPLHPGAEGARGGEHHPAQRGRFGPLGQRRHHRRQRPQGDPHPVQGGRAPERRRRRCRPPRVRRRPAAAAARQQPGRLHVHRERPGRRQPRLRRAGDQPVGAHHRPDVHGQAVAAQRGGEQRRGRAAAPPVRAARVGADLTATTTSPGRSPSARPPQIPAIASGPPSRVAPAARDRRAPIPVRRTAPPLRVERGQAAAQRGASGRIGAQIVQPERPPRPDRAGAAGCGASRAAERVTAPSRRPRRPRRGRSGSARAPSPGRPAGRGRS